MGNGIVPGEAVVPVEGGQVRVGEGSGHVGGGPGGVDAPGASGARVPGEAGVIWASGSLCSGEATTEDVVTEGVITEALEDGGEEDDTVEDDDTSKAVVTEAAASEGLDGETPRISSTRDLSLVSRF